MESDLGTALMAPLWMLLSFVALGVICARRLAIDPRPIATLLIYVIAPLTFFRGLNLGGPTPNYLLLTLGLFLASSAICLLAHRLARVLFPAQEAAVVAFSAGTGNTGYFGLPVAMILLPPEGVTLYLFCILGITLYEFTLGFYISARGQFSIRQSLIRIARLPLVYAFLIALLVEAAGITLPPIVHQGLDVFPSTYTLLGMMIIGMTLGRVTLGELDLRFIAACAVIRYVFWPLASLLAVLGLSLMLPVTPELAMALLLLGVVPMAANVVVVSMELSIAPEKGAMAVLLTTLAAPLLIPFYLPWMIQLTGLA
ncbi:AEC family transporter [Pistricoccus aurantiacus]|uniref:AEC family transporter n=1 Tax=Pistricoccus aurantiacus TaxID=1883414 RepID=UPI0036313C47